MRILKCLLEDYVKNKSGVHQLDFIEELLQAKVNDRVFVKLDSRYAYHFSEYYSCFGRALELLKSMYVMNNSGKLFSDELTYLLINEAGFKRSQCQMSIYYKYAPDRKNCCFILC